MICFLGCFFKRFEQRRMVFFDVFCWFVKSVFLF